jgi:pimeloyl-ACP methyl ester carboxylesterase
MSTSYRAVPDKSAVDLEHSGGHGPEGRLVEVPGGVALWTVQVGAGEPLVVLPGGGPGCTAWTDFAPLVEYFPDRRMVFVDPLNFGRSSAARVQGPAWTTMADQVRAALLAIDVPQADVVAGSLGGAVAIALAAVHPDAVRRLVLTGVEPVDEGQNVRTPQVAEDVTRVAYTYYDGEGPTRERLLEIMRRLEWHDVSRVPVDYLEARFLDSLRPGFRSLVEDISVMGEPQDLGPLLASVQARTLFLFGAHDVFVSDDYVRRLATLTPHGEAITVPDAGHHAQRERPKAYAQALRLFLDAD